LAKDIEYSEGQTEKLGIEVEISRDRIVPSTVLDRTRPQRIPVGDLGKGWNRFAFIW